MASISSSVATVSRTAPAQANMVAPFTGLKSNAAFPTTKKANDFSTLPSNGGRVQCMQVWPAYGNKKFETLSYLPPLSMAPTVMMASSATAVAPFQGLKSTASLPVARRSSRSLGNVSNGGRIRCMAGAEEIVLQPIKEISGTVKLPGSKSLSNRILLLAALSEGTTVVDNLLNSEDVHYMLGALRTLGLSVEADKAAKRAVVVGCGGKFPVEDAKEEVQL